MPHIKVNTEDIKKNDTIDIFAFHEQVFLQDTFHRVIDALE